jgi:hypothetical protein
MKKILPLLLLVSVCCHAQDIQRQNATYSPVATIITDLNADNRNDTISAYGRPVGNDHGKFTKLTVSIDGRRITYTAKGAWDTVYTSFSKVNKNDVDSPYVFVHKESECSYVLLFGYEYAGGPEEFSILKIKGRQQEMLFDNKLGYPKLLTDLDNDGRAELVAQTVPVILKADAKGMTETYSPFIVYNLSPAFDIDKTLTEKYNLGHYVWAGIKPNNTIEVFYPNDGSKPKLIKTN